MTKKKTISLYDVKAIIVGNDQKLIIVTRKEKIPYEAVSSVQFDQESAVVSFEIDE